MTFAGILFAPWIAVVALVRQRDTFAREQATAFALERSELERRALDARFRLLQAQVEPPLPVQYAGECPGASRGRCSASG